MPGRQDQCYSSFVHHRLEFGVPPPARWLIPRQEMKRFKRKRQSV
jgi:hypothetical protein